MGEYGLLITDCRGAKTFDSVPGDPWPFLTSRQWQDLHQTLGPGGAFEDVKMLVWATQVPIVFFSRKITEKIAPKADDFEGHWCYKHHEREQIAMLNLLYDWTQRRPGRGIVLAGGDMHLGNFTEISRFREPWAKQISVGPMANKTVQGLEIKGTQLLRKVGTSMPDGWSFKHTQYQNVCNFGLIRTYYNALGFPDSTFSLAQATPSSVVEKYQYSMQGTTREIVPFYQR
jgi:hypothetical protein